MSSSFSASSQVPVPAHWKRLVYCLMMSRDGSTYLEQDWWRSLLKPFLGDMLSTERLYDASWEIEAALMNHVRSNYGSRCPP